MVTYEIKQCTHKQVYVTEVLVAVVPAYKFVTNYQTVFNPVLRTAVSSISIINIRKKKADGH